MARSFLSSFIDTLRFQGAGDQPFDLGPGKGQFGPGLRFGETHVQVRALRVQDVEKRCLSVLEAERGDVE